MGVPTIVGVGAEVNGIGALAVPYPASYTAIKDDVGYIIVECETADTITAPANWSQLNAISVVAGTTSKLTVLWSRFTAGQAAPTIADPGDHGVARMFVVRGVRLTGTPVDLMNFTTEGTADTTVSIPGGNTTVPECLIIAIFGTGQDTASTAGATAWANSLINPVERMDDWTSSGLGGGFAMASGPMFLAGAVGAVTATLSLTANTKTLAMFAIPPQSLGLRIADDFNRANANPIGAPWVTVTGVSAMQITSNAGAPSTLASDCAARYDGGVSWNADQYSQAAITVTGTTANTGPFVSVRVSSTANTQYFLAANKGGSNNVTLGKFVAGAFTQIWQRTKAITDGDVIRLEVIGTTLRAYINGVQLGADSTDASIATGAAGMGYSSTTTAATLDNWEGGSLPIARAKAPGLPQTMFRSSFL